MKETMPNALTRGDNEKDEDHLVNCRRHRSDRCLQDKFGDYPSKHDACEWRLFCTCAGSG